MPEKSTAKEKKYIALDHGGVIDGTQKWRDYVLQDDDLLLSEIDTDGYRNVLIDGVKIVAELQKLVGYGYEILCHSKNKEQDQKRCLNQIINAYNKKKLEKPFPPITALVVFDEKKYSTATPENPAIEIIDLNNGRSTTVIGYGQQESDGKGCLRKALCAGLSISDKEKHNITVFDDGETVVNTALIEGYDGWRVTQEKGEGSLLKGLVKMVAEAVAAEAEMKKSIPALKNPASSPPPTPIAAYDVPAPSAVPSVSPAPNNPSNSVNISAAPAAALRTPMASSSTPNIPEAPATPAKSGISSKPSNNKTLDTAASETKVLATPLIYWLEIFIGLITATTAGVFIIAIAPQIWSLLFTTIVTAQIPTFIFAQTVYPMAQ